MKRAQPKKTRRPARAKAAPKAAQDKVIHALRRVLPHLPPQAIRPDSALIQDLGVDSLKIAELSIAFEDAFGHPVFLGEVFAQVEDASALTVAQLALFLAGEDL